MSLRTTSTEGKKTEGADGEKDADVKEEEEAASIGLSDEDSAYLESLKFNLNALLPNSLSRRRGRCHNQTGRARRGSDTRTRKLFLGQNNARSAPSCEGRPDSPSTSRRGFSLLPFLHLHDINCRYLGRLAKLAREQEDNDARITGGLSTRERIMVERKRMPKFWLELLECELVARTALLLKRNQRRPLLLS